MRTAADLPRLAAQRRHVVKDEAEATVEVLGLGADAVVAKTYRNRGLRWLQTLGRKSRAQREHENLAAIVAAGVPCVEPLGWSAARRWLGVDASTLLTRFLPDCVPLRDVLRASPPLASRARAALATAMGALVARLHRSGFLWCTPMPRNVLVVGDVAAARLVVCDTPSVVRTGRDLHAGRLARIDLFLGAFSPSRRRDWSRVERLRWLLGYANGERALARRLWRVMQRRRPLQNAIERALAMATLTYVRGRLRPQREGPSPT